MTQDYSSATQESDYTGVIYYSSIGSDSSEPQAKNKFN